MLHYHWRKYGVLQLCDLVKLLKRMCFTKEQLRTRAHIALLLCVSTLSSVFCSHLFASTYKACKKETKTIEKRVRENKGANLDIRNLGAFKVHPAVFFLENRTPVFKPKNRSIPSAFSG